MARLREVRVFPWGAPPLSLVNSRFASACDPVVSELRRRLEVVELQARFALLAIPLVREQRGNDATVEWWLEEAPQSQFEQAATSLPRQVAALGADEQRRIFVHLLCAVLDRLAPLRGWDQQAVRDLTRGLVPGQHEPPPVPIVFMPPPAIRIWGGGGPTNDKRTRPYLARNGARVRQFEEDQPWWDWWLGTGRTEVDMSVSFEGATSLRVSVTEQRVSFHRVRSPSGIPRNRTEAGALADQDLLEALARLRSRVGLPAHPELGVAAPWEDRDRPTA